MNSGDRIKQVRELCGFTQIELAKLVDRDQSFIAQIEGGLKEPPEQLIKVVAFKTGFPPNFFKLDPAPEFPFGSLVMRAHASLTRREKLRAYRYAQLAFEVAEKLQGVSRIAVDLPRVDIEPIEAARVMRSHFGLSPDRPVGNLLNVIEKMGVLIVLVPLKLPNLDAFSLWAGNNRETPVIAASASQPGDRLRFSISHELWHLISQPRGKPLDIEKQANIFAAEFLMPRAGIGQEITTPVTLTSVAELKSRWGVAMQAIIRRAVDLNVITERQYHYLMQQMSARGWRITEPVEIPKERPTALARMIEKASGPVMSLPSAFIKSMSGTNIL